MHHRILPSLLMVAASMTLSGCFLRAALHTTTVTSISDEIDLTRHALAANATTGVCRDVPFEGRGVECTYIIDGGQVTSTFTLISEFGVFGVIIDPLVLEVPVEVTAISGTYSNDLGDSGALRVYPGLNVVPVDDDESLRASPGHQLVIVDLPEGVPVDGVEYSYELDFERLTPAGSAAPLTVRAMLTARVETGFNEPFKKVYYPPLLPCTSDMSAATELNLPLSPGPTSILPASLPTACSERQYTFFAVPRRCDLDNDNDVDRDDIREVVKLRNQSVDDGDPRDVNADGVVNALDARQCALACTRSRCAT